MADTEKEEKKNEPPPVRKDPTVEVTTPEQTEPPPTPNDPLTDKAESILQKAESVLERAGSILEVYERASLIAEVKKTQSFLEAGSAAVSRSSLGGVSQSISHKSDSAFGESESQPIKEGTLSQKSESILIETESKLDEVEEKKVSSETPIMMRLLKRYESPSDNERGYAGSSTTSSDSFIYRSCPRYHKQPKPPRPPRPPRFAEPCPPPHEGGEFEESPCVQRKVVRRRRSRRARAERDAARESSSRRHTSSTRTSRANICLRRRRRH